MKKLTRAQKEVVKFIKYHGREFYYGYNYVQFNNVSRYCGKSTFNSLINLNIIKPTDQKDIYVLSEKE